jgi:hypothetical protein
MFGQDHCSQPEDAVQDHYAEASSVISNKVFLDPIKGLFVEKIREYATKKKSSGGKLVDSTMETEDKWEDPQSDTDLNNNIPIEEAVEETIDLPVDEAVNTEIGIILYFNFSIFWVLVT